MLFKHSFIHSIISLLYFRYIDSLYYGLKSNKSKGQIEKQVTYYKQMIYEDADATLLRLFECFMEAAPQIVLQIYIYAQLEAESPNTYTVTGIFKFFLLFLPLSAILQIL